VSNTGAGFKIYVIVSLHIAATIIIIIIIIINTTTTTTTIIIIIIINNNNTAPPSSPMHVATRTLQSPLQTTLQHSKWHYQTLNP
jgi:hypothetical protein